MTAPHWLTITELAASYRAKTLSPVELLEALLARIAALDPKINAFIRVEAESARLAARQAETEILAGRSRGPLHGVPVGLKDIIDVAGLPTTGHSKIGLDRIATADADVVTRLREAGAIIIGKLATHEFALGGPAFDLPFPPARNPWDPGRHTGGSSSGSGAGLAAGFFPAALGTDTGGSVRNPAGLCGVVGLKPTYDLVSRRGVFPLAQTLDHVGPMTRSVGDAALLLHALSGHDAGTDLGLGVEGLRIGYVRHFHESDMPAEPDVARALDHVARSLAAEGAIVSDIRLPDLNAFTSVNRVILQSEAWAIHAPWLRERPQDYGHLARRRLLPGAFLTAEDYVMAQRRRRTMIKAVEAALGQVDVLLTANAMDVASPIDDEAELNRTYPRQARTPFNVTGHPAISVPSGFSKGLPMSAQFVGRYYDEKTLLRVAAAWERAGGLMEQHPSL